MSTPARANWLGTQAVMVAGPIDVTGDGSGSFEVTLAGSPVALDTEAVVLDAGADRRVLIVGHLPQGTTGGRSAEVTLPGAGHAIPVPAFEADGAEVRALLRDQLGGLEADPRTHALEFLLAATARYVSAPGGMALARRLSHFREALREQLPRATVADGAPYATEVERIYAIDHECFWLKGWVHDDDRTVASVTAVSPEGARVELRDRLYRHVRIDIDERFAAGGTSPGEGQGLVGQVVLDCPSRLPDGWVVELRTSTGAVLEVQGPAVERRIRTVRAHVLGDMAAERPGQEQLLLDHVHPALQRIQARLREDVTIDAVVEVGTPRRAAPGVSVVVPLYKRIDFIEHQLLHFSRDPELREAELVYVLDSPELADDVLTLTRAIAVLHGLSLRVVLLRENAGYSAANNAGVSVARGRRLLLLNSDVIPDQPGWLGKMSAFYDASPDIGALGPKLLYEDDSLQHAGLYFARKPGERLWVNHHYFKGMHRSFPAANLARAVPAVTAACMMVDRDLYEQAGGLSHAYVQGGYEDSDLCLRLIELGRRNWYMPGAELYHLEAQSYTSEVRKAATQYNTWLHTHLWNERIEAVAAEYAQRGPSGRDSVVAEPAR